MWPKGPEGRTCRPEPEKQQLPPLDRELRAPVGTVKEANNSTISWPNFRKPVNYFKMTKVFTYTLNIYLSQLKKDFQTGLDESY